MATAYIVNRVEAGEYPLAIAYSALLIVFMLVVILLVQMVIGERKLGRRGQQATAAGRAPATATLEPIDDARGFGRIQERGQALRRGHGGARHLLHGGGGTLVTLLGPSAAARRRHCASWRDWNSRARARS